jgi:adrenodoxin-NADP+ reductase
VCGWLKRGPTGIIGTNLLDAEETIGSLDEDSKAGLFLAPEDSIEGSPSPLIRLLGLRRPYLQVVDFPAWKKVDSEEVARGAKEGRIRSKIVELSEMLKVANET